MSRAVVWWAQLALLVWLQWWCVHHVRATFSAQTLLQLGDVTLLADDAAPEEPCRLGDLRYDATGEDGWSAYTFTVPCAHQTPRRVVWDDHPEYPLLMTFAQGSALGWEGSAILPAGMQDVRVLLPLSLAEVPQLYLQDTTAAQSSWLDQPCTTEAMLLAHADGSSEQCWATADMLVQKYDSVRAPEPGEVVISEVLWAGMFDEGRNYADDEWLELASTADVPLSLADVVIDGAAKNHASLQLPDSLEIPPRGMVIIGRRPSVVTTRPYDWQTSLLSLSNTEGGLTLLRSDGTTLDALPAGGWPGGVNDVAGRVRASVQRRSLQEAGTNMENWAHCRDDRVSRCRYLYRYEYLRATENNWATPWQPSLL